MYSMASPQSHSVKEKWADLALVFRYFMILIVILAVISPKQNPADIQLAHTSGLVEFIATSMFIPAQKAQMIIVIASPNHG
jgi:hypothetical protein